MLTTSTSVHPSANCQSMLSSQNVPYRDCPMASGKRGKSWGGYPSAEITQIKLLRNQQNIKLKDRMNLKKYTHINTNQESKNHLQASKNDASF